VKMYIKKMGFMEGMRGLVFAVMFSWVHYLKWAKYWELTRENARSGKRMQVDKTLCGSFSCFNGPIGLGERGGLECPCR